MQSISLEKQSFSVRQKSLIFERLGLDSIPTKVDITQSQKTI